MLEKEQCEKSKNVKKKNVNHELLVKRRLDKEAYQKEIQEQQYKSLIHLLTTTQAFYTFMLTKANNSEKKTGKRKTDSIREEVLPMKRFRESKNTPINVINKFLTMQFILLLIFTLHNYIFND